MGQWDFAAKKGIWPTIPGRMGHIYGDDMAVCQNLPPLVNIKIAGKWMFIPLKMVLIGIDPYPFMGMI